MQNLALLWHVKRGQGGGSGVCVAFVLGALSLCEGCGYRSVAGNASERLCVIGTAPRVPDWGAVRGALQGARMELARAGELAEEGKYPCVVVEITRVTETGTGVLVDSSSADVPRARGTAVAVLGRAWVESKPGLEVSRETGDMQRVERHAVAESLNVDAQRHQDLAARAGERLGRDLARAVLGFPVPQEELP